MTGHFTAHHAFLAQLFLDRIDAHTADIDTLSARIETLMEPFLPSRELLESIPGFSQRVAEVFIAETGADMSVFPTAAHLASWVGTSPRSHESAGRSKSTKTRPGNRYLKGVLGVAALAASRSKNTYLSVEYRRIAARRGPMKALVALEHSMLIAAFTMLTNGDFYRDPDADYFTQRQPVKTKAGPSPNSKHSVTTSTCNPCPPPPDHPHRSPPPKRRRGTSTCAHQAVVT